MFPKLKAIFYSDIFIENSKGLWIRTQKIWSRCIHINSLITAELPELSKPTKTLRNSEFIRKMRSQQRYFTITSFNNKRAVPLEYEPIDPELNSKVEQLFFDDHEYKCLGLRLGINMNSNEDFEECFKVNLFDVESHQNQQNQAIRGYFLTELILTELLNDIYQGKFPAKLACNFLNYLLSRNSIFTACQFMGIIDFIRAKNDWFNLKYFSDEQYKITISENSLFKYEHVDDLDVISDAFFIFIQKIDETKGREICKMLIKDFLFSNLHSFDWAGFCQDKSAAEAAVRYLGKILHPDLLYNMYFNTNCNMELARDNRIIYTGYLYLGNHLYSTISHYSKKVARSMMYEDTIIKMLNKLST